MSGPSVLHVAHYGGSYSGNFIASLRALSRPCRALDLRIVLAFAETSRQYAWVEALRATGTTVHLLPAEASLRRRAAAIARVARGEDARIIHSHFTTFDVPAWLAAHRLPHRPRIVWHLHSPFPPRRTVRWIAHNAVKLRVLSRSARAVTVSDEILKQVLGAGFPSTRAWMVPNGVDLDHAVDTQLGRDGTRRRLGIPDHARVALLFGWEPPRKGVDLALEAVGALARTGREILLVIVGGPALQQFVRERLGPEDPPWLRVAPPQECVADLYAAADVFLSASRAEGLPYAVGEALANGLPVVASDIPGLEWARNLDGVMFFPSGDHEGLARAIAAAAEWPPSRREAWAPAAREAAATSLSLERWAERIAAIYREALSLRPLARGATPGSPCPPPSLA